MEAQTPSGNRLDKLPKEPKTAPSGHPASVFKSNTDLTIQLTTDLDALNTHCEMNQLFPILPASKKAISRDCW